MTKHKAAKEAKAAHRRMKKENRKKDDEYEDDDFIQLNNQLLSLGLALKKIPGDGNCLFRALGDQLEGNLNNHHMHRSDVVKYMLSHREDFEPFVEDDISFDDHIRNLSENGTFGGNDSIVAFARLHNLTVVIHQLDKPLWQIHGGPNGSPGSKEAHISYHNGDHYNSVRRAADVDSNTPASIRLTGRVLPFSPTKSNKEKENRNSSQYGSSEDSDDNMDGEESDYENSPNTKHLERLASQVTRLTGINDFATVINALENSAYCVQVAVDSLLQSSSSKSSLNNASIWSQQGTATRILGTQAAAAANSSGRPENQHTTANGRPGNHYASAGNRPVNQNANRNAPNKRQKKRQMKLEKEARKREEARDRRAEAAETTTVLRNIEALTI